MLCNLVASELVLPIGSLSDCSVSASIEKLMQARLEYDVSVEAFLTRVAKISELPVGVFVSSPRPSSDGSRKYAIDYYVGSPTAPQLALPGVSIPESSIVRKITAIGHTDVAAENWMTGAPIQIECVDMLSHTSTRPLLGPLNKGATCLVNLASHPKSCQLYRQVVSPMCLRRH